MSLPVDWLEAGGEPTVAHAGVCTLLFQLRPQLFHLHAAVIDLFHDVPIDSE